METVKSILERLLLIRGPVWHRLFLAAFYLMLAVELYYLYALFSRPFYEDPLERSHHLGGRDMFGENLIVFFVSHVAFGVWAVGAIAFLIGVLRKRTAEVWGLLWSCLTPLCFYACGKLIAAVCDGRVEELHRFLYRLQL